MKKIFILMTFLLFIVGCGKSEQEVFKVEKINDVPDSYSIQDFLKTGFKTIKEYDVDELPLAQSVFWGFWDNGILGPKEFEIRFYNSHKDAKTEGIKYVEEVTGKDAVLTKAESSWKEGIKDRRWGGFYLHGTIDPKYYDYVIYGNFIILCEGRDSEQSFSRCSELISKATEKMD